MNRSARWSTPPHDGGDRAQVKLRPDARNCDQHALAWRAPHYALRGVGEKGRREVDQGEPHLVHRCAKMSASNSVRCLMDRGQDKGYSPEHSKVGPGFVGEVKKLQRVATHLLPMQREDRKRHCKATER